MPSVIAIGLVAHGVQGVLHPPGLQADDFDARGL